MNRGEIFVCYLLHSDAYRLEEEVARLEGEALERFRDVNLFAFASAFAQGHRRRADGGLMRRIKEKLEGSLDCRLCLLTIGELLHASGQVASAESVFRRGTQLHPGYEPFYFYRGFCLQAMGKHDAAARAYRVPYQAGAVNIWLLNNLGECLNHVGQHGLARVVLEEAVRRNFTCIPDVDKNLAVAYHRLGQTQPLFRCLLRIEDTSRLYDSPEIRSIVAERGEEYQSFRRESRGA
jgi:tetratricopeptide (TPR) repeat protein